MTSLNTTKVVTNSLNQKRERRVSNKKYCGVCGDVALSNHFGGLCCNSCKAFFRRSVVNDTHLRFYCINKARCVISISNRKNCRYCRLNRCFAIGMSQDGLWTEDQRKKLVKFQNTMNKQNNQYDAMTTADIMGHFSSKYGEFQSEILTSDFLKPLEMRQLESFLRSFNGVVPSVDNICCSHNCAESPFSDSESAIEVFHEKKIV